MKVLIHHHAPVFKDKKNSYWVQSFIGIWTDQLAHHFEEVGLLLSETSVNDKQDYQLVGSNLRLHRLKPNLGSKNRMQRYSEIRKIGESIRDQYDLLLIRGITPKQKAVFDAFKGTRIVFLLVGSLEQGKPKLKFEKKAFLKYIMYLKRLHEFKEIAKKALVFVNSPLLADEVLRITSNNARFTPTNTISIQEFRENDKHVTDQIRLLYVGRMDIEKGIFDLAMAFNYLKDDNRQFFLDMVGPYSKKIREAFMSMVSKDKHPRVIWHGFIPYGQKLLDFYWNASIYILPSHHEGFPHTIWEAAAMKVPIITTRVGGIPGLVNESMVYFVNVADYQSIVTTIYSILNSHEKSRMKTIKMYNYAKGYTIESCTKMLSNEIYRITSE